MHPTPIPSRPDAARVSRARRFARLFPLLLCLAAPLRAGWGEDSIRKECDYIVDCTFTEYAQNHSQAQNSDDAYGCINVIRISTTGKADWVQVGESGVAAIGLMAGAQRLWTSGEDISTYEAVLSRYFNDWMIDSGQVFETNPSNSNFGGARTRIYYNTDGSFSSSDSAGSTTSAQLICAAWKYYEFLRAIGKTSTASTWFWKSWPTMKQAGYYLRDCYNPTYKMSGGRPDTVNTQDLWITSSCMSHAAFNCLERWCARGNITRPFAYLTYASNLQTGINGLKDTGSAKNFRRFLDQSAGYVPSYGEAYDQLCHLPYEADVIVPGTYCKSLCDWWQDNMTYQTTNASDWRYYGTTWHLYFAGSPENDYLYPGPALQMAKTEWKYYKVTGDTAYRTRAANRLMFADGTNYSNLWMGANGQSEAGVPNGIVDWRSALDYNTKASDWARFADTSAYFIEVVLMIIFDTDTTYQPVL